MSDDMPTPKADILAEAGFELHLMVGEGGYDLTPQQTETALQIINDNRVTLPVPLLKQLARQIKATN